MNMRLWYIEEGVCSLVRVFFKIVFLTRLKREKFVVEKEARVVLLQMVCALRYLNNPSSVGPDGSLPGEGDSHEDNGAGGGSAKKRSIIHFDLKPANILFDEYGDVKITGKLKHLVFSHSIVVMISLISQILVCRRFLMRVTRTLLWS